MGWFHFDDRKRVYNNQIGNGAGSNGTSFGHKGLLMATVNQNIVQGIQPCYFI